MKIFGRVLTQAQALAAAAGIAVILAVVAAATSATLMGRYKDAQHATYVSDQEAKQAQRDAAVATAARQAQKVQDDITLASALAEAKTQERVVTRYRTLTQEVPRYVTVEADAVACVPYGLVRVLDAAALGRDPADLELPSGYSDSACAPIEASALAAGILDNYRAFDQNAAQLDALSADVLARVAAANSSAAELDAKRQEE